MRPAPNTPLGEQWELGARQGWGWATAETERLRVGLEDAVNTLEAMDLHVDNPLYERLRKILEG